MSGKIRLVAFDKYYRGPPKIAALEIENFSDQRASWAALMRGDVDAVHEIAPNAVDFVQAEGQTTVKTYPFVRPVLLPARVQRPASPAQEPGRPPGAELRRRPPGGRRSRAEQARQRRRRTDLAVPLGLQHGAEDLHAQFGGGDTPPRLRGPDGEAVEGKRPDAQPAAPPLHDAREGRDDTRRSPFSSRSSCTRSASTWTSRPCLA